HSLDIADVPVLNKLPKRKSSLVSNDKEAIGNNSQMKDKEVMNVKDSKPLSVQTECRSPRVEKQTEAPKTSTLSKVLEDPILSSSSSSTSNKDSYKTTDTDVSDTACQVPLPKHKMNRLPVGKEDNSTQRSKEAERESLLAHPSYNLRLEACLKDAVIDVLGGLPEDWLHSPDNTTEVFLFFMSALESFPRPQYTLKQVLSAIIHGHQKTAC
ncbi:unnamed protein product, partial [Meganyctiphanes norvegica]